MILCSAREMESGTHTLVIEFSTPTEILASPANTSCYVAHQPQKKLSNASSLADQHTNERNLLDSHQATWPKKARSEPDLAPQNTTSHEFSTKRRNNPENVSGGDTGSCRRLDRLRGCDCGIPAEIWSWLVWGSQDPVGVFALNVVELTLYTRYACRASRSLAHPKKNTTVSNYLQKKICTRMHAAELVLSP